jgi:TetR/AcrR family transcriptional repressor of lmrAB and yxaGH operons
MPLSARQRMIQSAALLMRERGVEATSFSEVLALSRAPRGSIYHHFPNGKAQLIEEATRYAGDYIAAGLAAALADQDPVSALRSFAASWRQILGESDFEAGCPVVAATLEGNQAPNARKAAGEAFSRWTDILVAALRQHVAARRARSLSTLVIAAIEGAVILARAQQSSTPLSQVTNELEAIITSALKRH